VAKPLNQAVLTNIFCEDSQQERQSQTRQITNNHREEFRRHPQVNYHVIWCGKRLWSTWELFVTFWKIYASACYVALTPATYRYWWKRSLKHIECKTTVQKPYPMGPLQLRKKMAYNLRNARNKKSASRIPKWPSLRFLKLKSKFIRQFEFSENLEDLYGKCCWRASLQRLFFKQILF